MSHHDQVRRFYDQIWNIPDLEAIPLVVHPDLTFRGSLGTECRGHRELADYVRSVSGSLSSYRCDVQHVIVEGDSAAARMTFSGQHTGVFLGHAPTGRAVSWSGAAFFRVEDDLVRDLWVLGDLQALLAQLAVEVAG